jgi:hypothetical protein
MYRLPFRITANAAQALLVVAALSTPALAAQEPAAANPAPPATAPPETTWRFAVSGDSRNCGDVVMPAIAAEVKKQAAVFYWHLGDFRYMASIDEDMRCGPRHLDGLPGHIQYGLSAWKDFRENQADSFGSIPVFLGIGNHEMIFHTNTEDFLKDFANWLDSPVLHAQRIKDDPEDRSPHTYYHWMDRGIDFINLDNASSSKGFSEPQMRWFQGVVSRDLADAKVKTLVVGMHKALPDSISLSHSMSETKAGIRTGREVYNTLLAAQKAGKKVYILASHSHYYADNIYDTEYWRTTGGVLPGWIAGTAGAHRYVLPPGVQAGPHARTDVYGYLLATAHSGGAQDGAVDFSFVEIVPGQVPEATAKRFDPGFVAWCFANNRDPDFVKPTCREKTGEDDD